MYRQLFLVGAAALGMAACQTAPKQTVLNLDTTDPKWVTDDCVAARKAAHRYNDGELTRAAAGVAGTVAAGPVVGVAATTALSAGQDDEREDLNNKIRRACVSKPGDPLGDPVGDRIAASTTPPDAQSASTSASATEPAPE
jgi:hypothetical protein